MSSTYLYFPSLLKERFTSLPLYFQTLLKGCLIMQMTLCVVTPTLSVIRGCIFLVGEIMLKLHLSYERVSGRCQIYNPTRLGSNPTGNMVLIKLYAD